jgi:hypothetical protein
MTKRDYIRIAAVLDANHTPLATVQDFADMLQEDNALFDRARFVKASTEQLVRALEGDWTRLTRARDERAD